MRFAGVKELKQKTMELIKKSEKEDILITAYGKPVAVLHHVDEDDLADYLIENDPEFKKRIEESYAEYLTHGGTPIEDVIENLKKRHAGKKV
jgi:prevent-host-death family protein